MDYSSEGEVIKFFDAKDNWGELSNFWTLENPLQYLNIDFPSSEHLYQSLKYIPDDPNTIDHSTMAYIKEIATAKTPYMSKLIAGQTITNRFDWQRKLSEKISSYVKKGVKSRGDWDDVKVDKMLWVLRFKFNSDSHCRTILLSTGNKALKEASPYDVFWGIGRHETGKNMLGKLLERVRVELTDKDSHRTLGR